jgi:hypothetical protein
MKARAKSHMKKTQPMSKAYDRRTRYRLRVGEHSRILAHASFNTPFAGMQ